MDFGCTVASLLGNRRELVRQSIFYPIPDTIEVIPLNVGLNRLLAWCISLGSPVKEEVLEIQVKSYDTPVFTLQVTHSALH